MSHDHTARSGAPRTRLPYVTYILAAGVFLMGTTEFIVAGILPEVASGLGVTVANAGLLITVFAIGMIIGTPVMAILTLKLQRRLTLTLALLVFALGHVIVAATSNFAVILGARFLTAVATGAFWAVAAVVAAKAAGPANAPKALGIVLGGGMLANALGVPLGSFAGQLVGWRGPFWGLAVLAVLAAVMIYRQVAVQPRTAAVPSVRAEIRSLRDVRVWLVFAGAAIVCGSSLAAYTFISPLLTTSTGLPSAAVPLVLLVYGVGAFIGTNLGGYLGSTRPYTVLFTSAAATFLVLVGLALFSHLPAVTIVLVGLLGLFGMSTNPILISKAVGFADHAPTLASAMATAAFNVGTAVGSWIAGYALESALGVTGPVVVGAAIGALYFLPLIILWRKERFTHPTPSPAPGTGGTVGAAGTVAISTGSVALPRDSGPR